MDLGEGSSIFDEEAVVEVPDVVPTMVVEEEDSSVEVFISEKEMKREQAVGTGTMPVPEVAVVREEAQVVGTGEPVLNVGRSGDEPDLMEIDAGGRTGEVPVREFLEIGTGSEPVPEEAEAGDIPELGSGEGDLRFEDFPRDDFEKVGEFTPEEPSQTPPVPGPEQSAQSPSGTEPRRKRFKTVVGRTDLPWVRKLKALKEKTSSSSPKSPPTQPTRKSYRLAAQGIRSSSTKQGPPVIEEIPSSSEGSPVRDPAPAEEHPESPVRASEQGSTKTSPQQTPAPKPVLKRKAVAQPSPATHSQAEPSTKRPKAEVVPSAKLEKF